MARTSTLMEYPSVEHCLGEVSHFDDTPAWIYGLDNPYLHGIYAPTLDEMSVENLQVEGELPADLEGAYFRNGPNPVFEPKNRHHPFDGDGMIHGVYFRDGKASYRNRYVQTSALVGEHELGQSVSPGVMGPFDYDISQFGIKDTSNTDVFCYNGDIMALWYNAGHPYRLDGHSLETKGHFNLDGRDQLRMSAHSKVDWETGELLFFDYGDEAPYMSFGVADRSGVLQHETAIVLPGPKLPHDMGFTSNYVVLHDLPFFHDMEVLRRHKHRVVTFYPDIPTRFGIVPRRGNGADVRLEANAYRWRFNLRTGEVREGDIDDLNTEFNKSNPIFHGVKSQFSYHQHLEVRGTCL